VGKALDITADDLLSLFQDWNPGAQVQDRLKKLAAANHAQPSWELSMARKDTQLFLDAARVSKTNLTLLPTIAALMDEWIAKGFGNHDWTIVGEDYK
jgi:3-hydroxyisobutyrate dehydrogenase